MNLATDINEYFKLIGMSLIEFTQARQKLEAMNLITSYLQVNDKNGVSTYTFMINEPLNFNDFIANQKYRHLLIRNVGQLNYEKFEHHYLTNRVPDGAINVSTNFESVFNDSEIMEVTTMNFQALHAKLAACTSLPIIIDNSSKNTIESYFKKYDLSFNEIEKCVTNSIAMTDDQQYQIDNDLLKVNFNKLVNSVNNINVLKNIQLNRNIKIFMQYTQREQLDDVFNDYNSLNAEQYLRAIVKTNLTSEQSEVINTLRDKYLLPDYIINLLMDYTLFKTNGNLNSKYINKVAQTVNALNLKTLSQVYDHFHFMNKVQHTFNEPAVKQEEIEWNK
jgi:replication initiation and membrane attachment protein